MAELAGLIIGSVALTSLFNDCVETFRNIEDARNFGREYQAYLVKLGAVELQFSRWGEAARRYPLDIPKEEEENAMAILGSIHAAFQHAAQISDSMKRRGKPNEFAAISDPSSSLDKREEVALVKFKELSAKYQKDVSFIAKAKWAFYKKNDFMALVDSVRDDVNDLVTLFPAIIPPQQQLATAEVSQIEQQQTIQDLGEVARTNGDEIMDKAAKERLRDHFGLSLTDIKLKATDGKAIAGARLTGKAADEVAKKSMEGTFTKIEVESKGDAVVGFVLESTSS